MLARPPGCSHRSGSMSTGQPGRLHHAMNAGSRSANCGIATCLIRAIDMVELSSTGLWPCRPLPTTVVHYDERYETIHGQVCEQMAFVDGGFYNPGEDNPLDLPDIDCTPESIGALLFTGRRIR